MTGPPPPAEPADDQETDEDSAEGIVPEVVENSEDEGAADAEVAANSGLPSIEMAMYQREGPLPPPAEMQAYYDIHPDVCFRLIKMAETAADARHEAGRDQRRDNEQFRRSISRIVFTVVIGLIVIVLALIALSAWLFATVNAWVGVGVLVVSPTTVLLAALSLLRRIFQRADDDDGDDDDDATSGENRDESEPGSPAAH